MAELGKLLAWVLRHEPGAIGIELDAAGWVEVEALLVGLRDHGRPCARAELERCVATDDKGRFELSADGQRIRAVQGHSIAIALELAPIVPPDELFHGTPTRFIASIFASGLVRGQRHHVHLSGELATALTVGRRRGRALVLRVDARRMHRDGYRFYRSANGVWLTEHVPPGYLRVVALASGAESRHESPVPEELELDIPDQRVAALAWGPPAGRPVLALHGWLDNAATFTELAPRLCAALELRIVALDLPGHGRSQHKRGFYHFVDSVADAIRAAEALGWDRYSLLGHSMGAGIASLLTGTCPERIERCVLIEGLGPLADEPAEAARRLARSLRSEARKRETQKRAFAEPEIAAERLCEATAMKIESARILVERGLEQAEDGWRWRADPRLRVDSRLRLSEEHVHAFLSAIRCPVLLIAARDGWPYDPALMRRRVATVAGLERVELPGHHHLHLDDPEAVANVMIPFLAPLFEGGPR